jgi:hypothetical protein
MRTLLRAQSQQVRMRRLGRVAHAFIERAPRFGDQAGSQL